MDARRGLTRRDVLRVGLGVVGVGLVAACGQQAPSAPTAAPAIAKPPSAPAGPTEQAAPTTAPASAPAAATPNPAGGARLGAQLVGKLEGPTIVTDPSLYPRTFKEAPQLAELVRLGTLPPVAQRVSQDPMVIKPLHEIGKYGGTLRRGFTGPGDKYNGQRLCGMDMLLHWDYTCTRLMPNVARGHMLQDGGRTLLIQLRRGMRWSDGEPFTPDDFVFWFEDMYQNKKLVPVPISQMSINGKSVIIEKVDESTIAYRSPDPYPVLPVILTGLNYLAGQAENGWRAFGGYAPAHYLKQFLPKYIGEDKAVQQARDAGVDNWMTLVYSKNDWTLNPDLPVLTPWKTVGPANTPSWVLERNPYSIWVDTEGNQLPYIDRVHMQLAENLEVLNLRVIAGESDFQERHTDLGKLPVFLENQQRGNYTVRLDPAGFGSDAPLRINMSYEADAEIRKLFDNKDFRIAMSLGIDRDQLNEALWLGMGTPGSFIISEDNPYNPGREYRTLNCTLDVKRANELLDGLGLNKKDAEGYRLRADGKGPLRIELMTQSGVFFPLTKVAEMVREQWKKIGLQADVSELERSLAEKRIAANEHQIAIRATDGIEDIFAQDPGNAFPSNAMSYNGPLYGTWFASNGAQGKQPPPRMKEMMDAYKKAYGVTDEERLQLMKQVWRILAEELWTIGTVGLSPATTGVRVVKNTLGNIAERNVNSAPHKSPAASRPEQYYFK